MYKVTKVIQKTKTYKDERPDYKYSILMISKEMVFGGKKINTLDGYFFSIDGHHELKSFKDEVDVSEFDVEESESEDGRVYKWLVSK